MKQTAPLDLARPIASLREVLGVSAYAVGRALGTSAQSGASAERAGDRVQVSTLVRAAAGLGFDVEVRLVPRDVEPALRPVVTPAKPRGPVVPPGKARPGKGASRVSAEEPGGEEPERPPGEAWRAWDYRRRDALRRGLPFSEPEPSR